MDPGYKKLVLAAALFVAGLDLGAAAVLAADFDKGVQLYGQKNYKGAIDCFENELKQNTQNSSAFYYEALCYQQMGDMRRAAQLYRYIKTNFPNTPAGQMSVSFLNRYDAANGGTTSGASLGVAAPSGNAVPFVDGADLSAQNVSDAEWEKLPEECRVPFTKKAVGQHLYIQCTVNNRPITAIFDTGAATCLFPRNMLQEAGIKPEAHGKGMAIGGVGSDENIGFPMVVDLQVGDIKRHMAIIVGAESRMPPLLGETFFNGYQYVIDNQGGFIHFTKKPRGGRAGARGRDEPFDTINVPFRPQNNQIIVTAKVNGNSTEMFFDTGADAIVFSLFSAEACGLHIPDDASRVMAGGVGGAAFGYSFHVQRIELGPIVKTNVPVIVLLTGGPPMPLLGQPFFSDKRFTIDNDNHVVKFVH